MILILPFKLWWNVKSNERTRWNRLLEVIIHSSYKVQYRLVCIYCSRELNKGNDSLKPFACHDLKVHSSILIISWIRQRACWLDTKIKLSFATTWGLIWNLFFGHQCFQLKYIYVNNGGSPIVLSMYLVPLYLHIIFSWSCQSTCRFDWLHQIIRGHRDYTPLVVDNSAISYSTIHYYIFI